MSDTPRNPCAPCGRCCRSYIVPVCGYDLWRISTEERLSPEQYLVIYPHEEPGLDSFRLEAEGPAYALALDKQGPFAPKKPCVFLLQLADGTTRCGVYAHRPVTCQIYPMAMWRGIVFQRSDALCPPDSWSASDIQRPSWRMGVARFHMHFDIYHEVANRWNARVAAHPQARFALPEYFSYLLNVYDRLAALDADLGAERLAEVQANWPTLPRPAAGLQELRVRAAEMPWLAYLTQARRIIDEFYPDVAPQPLLTLLPMRYPTAVETPSGGQITRHNI